MYTGMVPGAKMEIQVKEMNMRLKHATGSAAVVLESAHPLPQMSAFSAAPFRRTLSSIGSMVFIALLLALISSSCLADNLVLDPEFANCPDVTSYPAGTPTVCGSWVFTGSAGAVVGSTSEGFFANPTYSGTTTGYVNVFSSYGEISQEIPTIPGDSYLVDLEIAGNCCLGGGVSATFGGVGVYSASLTGPFSYEEESSTVIATSSLSNFVFEGQLLGGTVFLGDVTITNLTEPQSNPGNVPVSEPPPAALAALLAAAGGLAAALSQKKVRRLRS